MIFFTNSSQVSVIVIYYCLILLYLSDFEIKQRKQILKISLQFSMGFHSKIYEILDRVFLYFPHNFGWGQPSTMIRPSKHPKLNPLGIPIIFLPNILAGSGENWKKRGGSNFFQLVPMLKNEKFFFCFP